VKSKTSNLEIHVILFANNPKMRRFLSLIDIFFLIVSVCQLVNLLSVFALKPERIRSNCCSTFIS